MLKREIRGFQLFAIAIGGMIGSGWLFSPLISARLAGPGALISWIVAAICMIFIALPLCELGPMFPISGGVACYPTMTHGREMGFIFAWTSWLYYVVITPVEIQAVLQYGSHFFPSVIDQTSTTFHLTFKGYIVAILLLFLVTQFNTFGIRFLAKCGTYAGCIKLVVPFLAIMSFFYMGGVQGFTQNISLDFSSHANWHNIFSALSVGGIIFSFTGFQTGLMMAGEVDNPQRNLPLAILSAITVGFILYFLLQLSFIVATPQKYLLNGWQQLNYPGMASPLVGLALVFGLSLIALLLFLDSFFSPLGTALIYTTATSRILYGMALNKHLPAVFLKLNQHQVPYVALLINFVVGAASFLPFPGWQEMITFMSSIGVFAYSIGAICVLGLRKLQPERKRPFRLAYATVVCYISFYICNLMLHWCGFNIIWKLCVVMSVGLIIYISCQKRWKKAITNKGFLWVLLYMMTFLVISYLGVFDGINVLIFPYDCILFIPVSMGLFALSQRRSVLISQIELTEQLVVLEDELH